MWRFWHQYCDKDINRCSLGDEVARLLAVVYACPSEEVALLRDGDLDLTRLSSGGTFKGGGHDEAGQVSVDTMALNEDNERLPGCQVVAELAEPSHIHQW